MVVGAADVLSQAPGPVLRDLVRMCKSGSSGASYMPGSSILALPPLAAARKRASAAAGAAAVASGALGVVAGGFGAAQQ